MKRLFKSTRDVTSKQRDRDKKRATLALGKPLNGHPVHHHSRTQLVICENTAYHWLLHARQEILRAGGDPNLDDICRRCKRPCRLTELVEYRRCKPCARIEERELSERMKEREVEMKKAHASNVLSIGRSIRRMFRKGQHYEFDLSLHYPELSPSDVAKAKEIHARYLRLKRTA